MTSERESKNAGRIPVYIKAINAASHRDHRVHRGNLESGETTATIKAILFYHGENLRKSEKSLNLD